MANEWISSDLDIFFEDFSGEELKWLTDLYVNIVTELEKVFPDEASEVAIHSAFKDAKALVEASNKLYQQWETLKDSDEAKRMKSSFEYDMDEFKKKFKECCRKKMYKVGSFLHIFREFDREYNGKNIAMGVVCYGDGRLRKVYVKHFAEEIGDLIKEYALTDDKLLDWFDEVKSKFDLMDSYSDKMYENLLLIYPEVDKRLSTIKEYYREREKSEKVYEEMSKIYENRKRILKWFFTPIYNIPTLNYFKIHSDFSEFGKYFENLSFDKALESVKEVLKDYTLYVTKMFTSMAIVDVLEVFDKEDLVKDFCMGIKNSEDGIKNISEGKKITPFKFLKNFSVSEEYYPIDLKIEDWIQKKIPEFVKKLNTESESMCKRINDIEKKNYCSKEQDLKKYKLYVSEVLGELNKSLKERKKIIEDLFGIEFSSININEVKNKFMTFVVKLSNTFSKNFNSINSITKKK